MFGESFHRLRNHAICFLMLIISVPATAQNRKLLPSFFNTSAQPASSNNGGCDANDPSLPKCITFRANGGNEPPTCPIDQALQGCTVDVDCPGADVRSFAKTKGGGSSQANAAQLANAKHVFAYTHGFCGPTGDKSVDPEEAAWCSMVANGCNGMKYPSDDWHGPKGAECLVKYVAKHSPEKSHVEFDNCSQYKSGNLQCYEDLIKSIKANKADWGQRRLAIKNVTPDEARQLLSHFQGADAGLMSNFVLVEEEFDKIAVQQALAGTCASVAQSMKTEDYKFNENHVAIGGAAPGSQVRSAGRGRN